MRFERKHRETGGIDGGEGRGVQMGGSDPAAHPSGTRRTKVDEIDDEDALQSRPEADDFDDSGDASPGDRRRDPLRRSI